MDIRRPRVPAWAGDWTIAVAVAALLLGTGVSQAHPGGGAGLFGSVVLTAGGLALAARRRAPVLVLTVTGLCAVGYLAAGFDVLSVAYLVAVYAAVRAGHGALAVTASVTLLLFLHVTALLFRDGTEREALTQARSVLEVAWLIAAFAAGEALRQAERRAEEAERTKEETARRRADEERLHIARELHDALTHQISVIKVQSEVAVHIARRRGEQVPETLLAIQEAGREATRELRATLGALWDDGTIPPRALDAVPELVKRFQTTGLKTILTIEGRPYGVPVTVGRTAYRIVQEALTNIARHADATTAFVRIEYRPDSLALRVDDDGEAAADTAPTPGIGLLGMRERVTALGGRLCAEPLSEGGFTVQAELPVEQTS
ncbi:sensor histidine kinase [Streptomyces tendae]